MTAHDDTDVVEVVEVGDPAGGDADSAPSSGEGDVVDQSDDATIVDAEVVESSDVDDQIDTTVADPEVALTEAVDEVVADSTETPEERVARERDEYLNALRQMQADFENYRKRSFKQQGEAIDRATGRLVEDLLPVLDACDAGMEHGDAGVTAVFTALLGVLEKAGLERIDPLGATFDPTAHEAVLHEPADPDDEANAEPVVVEVMRTGYRWKERTLRASMVKVKG